MRFNPNEMYMMQIFIELDKLKTLPSKKVILYSSAFKELDRRFKIKESEMLVLKMFIGF